MKEWKGYRWKRTLKSIDYALGLPGKLLEKMPDDVETGLILTGMAAYCALFGDPIYKDNGKVKLGKKPKDYEHGVKRLFDRCFPEKEKLLSKDIILEDTLTDKIFDFCEDYLIDIRPDYNTPYKIYCMVSPVANFVLDVVEYAGKIKTKIVNKS